MMAAARARRSPTNFMGSTIARAAGLASGIGPGRSPFGRRARKRLLDDQPEMLVAGFFLLGREQDLDQQAVGRRAIGDDQELRGGGAGARARLALPGGVLLVMERGEEVGEARDLDPGGAA